jgi:hypothetical protein
LRWRSYSRHLHASSIMMIVTATPRCSADSPSPSAMSN